MLNLKGSYSCIVESSSTVIATLLEANSLKLSKITVEVEDARALFLPETRGECADSWKGLDVSLATLAWRSMKARGKKLVFVMEVMCADDTIRRAKKWLPRFLPRFDEEGSLHVHDGEDDSCHFDDYDAEDEKACMGRAVLKEYGYESESDEKTEEGAAKMGGENQKSQEGEGAKGSGAGDDGEGLKGGGQGDGEGENEGKE